jgi:hypothetical protein
MTMSAPDVALVPGVRARSRLSFHLGVTLLLSFFVFAGFGMTYWFPMASGTLRPAPPVVHVHGWVLSAWMILLVTQSWLVNARNVALHRSLGMFGIAMATAVLFMSAIITLLGLKGGVSRPVPSPDFLDAMYLSFMAILGFGTLFTLAMRHTRSPEIHRRLILLAILPLMPPGVNRFYMVPFGLSTIPVWPMYLTLDAIAAAILVQEWRSTGRVGRYSLIGAGWLLMQQLLHVPVAHSAWFAEFCQFVASLVRYR